MAAFARYPLGRRYQGRPNSPTLVRRVNDELADVRIDLPGEVGHGVDRHEADNATGGLGDQSRPHEVCGRRILQPPAYDRGDCHGVAPRSHPDRQPVAELEHRCPVSLG